MNARHRWALKAALLALCGCPSSTSTEGALTNGSFGYVCPNGFDSACKAVTTSTVPIPTVIAVGTTFELNYTVATGSQQSATAPESVAPAILSGGDGAAFQFLRAGTTGVIVRGEGGILDFTSITGEDVTGIALGGTNILQGSDGFGCPPVAPSPDAGAPDAGPDDAGLPDAGPGDAGPPAPDAGPPAPDAGTPDAGPPDAGGAGGGTPTLGSVTAPVGSLVLVDLDPIGSSGQTLAGALTGAATSSDATIVSVLVGPEQSLQLCTNAEGTALITVVFEGHTSTILVTVSGQP